MGLLLLTQETLYLCIFLLSFSQILQKLSLAQSQMLLFFNDVNSWKLLSNLFLSDVSLCHWDSAHFYTISQFFLPSNVRYPLQEHSREDERGNSTPYWQLGWDLANSFNECILSQILSQATPSFWFWDPRV